MESEGSGAREHGIWSFPESRSKKGHAAEPKVGNFWGHFFLTSGPQQFFYFTFRLRISKKVIFLVAWVRCCLPASSRERVHWKCPSLEFEIKATP